MYESGQKSAAAMLAALLLFSAVALLMTSVVAAQGEEDEEPSEEEAGEGQEIKREVEVKWEADGVVIESVLERENVTGLIENRFEVEFRVDGEVEINLEYEEEVEREEENEEVSREVSLEFEVEFQNIVEFVDVNNNGVFDEDENINTYQLAGKEFTPVTYETEVVNGVTVHRIATQTTDGVFGITLYAVGEFTTIGEEAVRPTEVKIDIEIRGFEYTHENSKLALECEIESEMEIKEEREVGDVEEEIRISHGDYQGFFSWKNTARVDNDENSPVRSTELVRGDDEKKLYLVYERGDVIIHDPKIGVLGAVGLGAVAPVIPWALIGIAAILSALLSIGATRYIVLRKGG